MSDAPYGMPLIRRAIREHRRLLVLLGAVAAVNVVAYATIVYPLGQRVANSEQRDRSADQALAQARAEQEQAAGTLTGKARAATELTTFYNDVLPDSLAGARRLTHLRLPQLARESNLRFDRSVYDPADERGSTLHRLKIEMSLGGSYADVRHFIHQLEIAPEFVVIDNVSLSEDASEDGLLNVILQLSTYYKDEGR
jgi:Tfp pilus assembly protein PilO